MNGVKTTFPPAEGIMGNRAGTKPIPFLKKPTFREFMETNVGVHFPGPTIVEALVRYIDEVIQPGHVQNVSSMILFDGTIFIATDQGVFRYDAMRDIMVPVSFERPENEADKPQGG
jgi:hypothetical protein